MPRSKDDDGFEDPHRLRCMYINKVFVGSEGKAAQKRPRTSDYPCRQSICSHTFMTTLLQTRQNNVEYPSLPISFCVFYFFCTSTGTILHPSSRHWSFNARRCKASLNAAFRVLLLFIGGVVLAHVGNMSWSVGAMADGHADANLS